MNKNNKSATKKERPSNIERKKLSKENNSNNELLNDFEKYKQELVSFSNNCKISKIKTSNEYFKIKQNDWIINKPISMYGIQNEDSPENSLPAYENAINKQCAILMSVQMLKDGTIVCYKGKTLGKLSSDGYITNLNSEQVKDLHIQNSIYTPPTLDEALTFIANRTEIIIELFNENKVGKMEENILKIIDEYACKFNCIQNVSIMSMNPYTLNWFFKNASYYTRIIKSCGFKTTKTYANIKAKKLRKLKFIKICHSEFTCYNAKDLPNKYTKKGKPIGLIAYNVNSQENYENIIKYCDNVIFSGFIPQI